MRSTSPHCPENVAFFRTIARVFIAVLRKYLHQARGQFVQLGCPKHGRADSTANLGAAAGPVLPDAPRF